ncbi:MAG: DUF2628 domain-containing protein [Rickettsiales bacterium]|nr:DUF2628 domain-containing protein [Rickettsiales bacterium]
MFGSNSMKLYAVYIKPDDDVPHETAEFVEEHFSLWAFVFHGFWCLYHGLWLYGALVLAVWGGFVGAGVQLGVGLISSFIIELAVRTLVGFDGNHWRSKKLRTKGYILSDVVSGESELAAKRRFYSNWLSAQS